MYYIYFKRANMNKIIYSKMFFRFKLIKDIQEPANQSTTFYLL